MVARVVPDISLVDSLGRQEDCVPFGLERPHD